MDLAKKILKALPSEQVGISKQVPTPLKPYNLIVSESGYGAIVHSEYLQKTFVLWVDHVPGVQIEPRFETNDKLVHCLYLLFQFGTREHSAVYRDSSYLIPKIEFEPIVWKQMTPAEGRAPSPQPKASPANPVRSESQSKTPEKADPVSSRIVLVQKGSFRSAFLYHQKKYTDDPKEIQGYLSKNARGYHVHAIFPQPHVIALDSSELFDRALQYPLPGTILFEPNTPFADLGRSNVFLKKDPVALYYIQGFREIVSDVPEIQPPSLARYPVPENLPNEPNIRERYLSAKGACYRPVIAKFLSYRTHYDPEVLSEVFAQDREGAFNDTDLFERLVSEGSVRILDPDPEPTVIGRRYNGAILVAYKGKKRFEYLQGQRYVPVETAGTSTSLPKIMYERDLYPQSGSKSFDREAFSRTLAEGQTVWWKSRGKWISGIAKEPILRTEEYLFLGLKNNRIATIPIKKEEMRNIT